MPWISLVLSCDPAWENQQKMQTPHKSLAALVQKLHTYLNIYLHIWKRETLTSLKLCINQPDCRPLMPACHTCWKVVISQHLPYLTGVCQAVAGGIKTAASKKKLLAHQPSITKSHTRTCHTNGATGIREVLYRLSKWTGPERTVNFLYIANAETRNTFK